MLLSKLTFLRMLTPAVIFAHKIRLLVFQQKTACNVYQAVDV